MHGEPLTGRRLALINNCAKGCGKAAAKAGCGGKAHIFGQSNDIEVSLMNGNIFGKRSPMGEAGLFLMAANLLVTRMAFRTSAAATNEGHGYPVSNLPVAHILANSSNDTSQFMPGHMGQFDIRIMPHPAVPIATADTGRLHLNHDAMRPQGPGLSG